MNVEELLWARMGTSNVKSPPIGGEKHYEWQLSVGNQWLRIDNDHMIETHYCHPGAKGITINTSHGKVFIDFDKLQTRNAGLNVRRQSLLPAGQTEDIGWYFRDDQLWREYGSQSSNTLSSSIGSRDVERQFTLNPRGSFSFTVGSTSYTLDFSSMTQANGITGLRRNVRRRPKFTTKTGSIYSMPVFPTASSSQLTDGGYKWEFMGDEGEWTEYQAHVCSFDSTAIERQYQLNPQGQLHFKIKRYTYTLDFSSMHQMNDHIGTRRAVRRTADNGSQDSSRVEMEWSLSQLTLGERLRTPRTNRQYITGLTHRDEQRFTLTPTGNLEPLYNPLTMRARRRTQREPRLLGFEPETFLLAGSLLRWQFQDIDGKWKDYSKGNGQCSMSSDDIELQYQQNPSGTIKFTTRSFCYELNFSAMTQRNLSTTTTRSVRRLNN
ncbi:uncharacterized protein si:ch211-244b2.3 isoform X1 [Larimichthys crocea]|uniref:uncharacterized protein si:ch211-244b2.3 isoform X1 n=1 Tax=Larimichthys crocea TaxID=215358 RepID=UPI000F5F71BD|nr:uncharacterized protein LOC104925084 isoform X1 [Larimichthys crocea]